MAKYIKVNAKVAKFLHLENDRNMVKDGNYLLWQGDMTAFAPLPELATTLEQIGGIALLPHEAREEQDGTNTRPLPTPKDERFIMHAPSEGNENADSTDAEADGEGAVENSAKTEAESEETEVQTDEEKEVNNE